MTFSPLKSGDLIEGQIEKIAFGGDGILRHRGFVVFIPFTAPGDDLICRLTEVKKSFARGELVELKKASPVRTKPLCPYFGVCGGCQLQHINYKEQSKYKLEAVKEALSRIGHLAPDKVSFVPTNLCWAYRRHITLHLKPTKKTFEAGYIAVDNHSLVVVRTCPIFNRFKDPVLRQLQDFVHTLPNPEEIEGRLTVLKNHRNQYILHFQFTKSIEIIDSLFNQLLQHAPAFAGIIMQTPAGQKFYGDAYSEQKIEGLTFRYTPETFIQNHPEQSVNIYQHICALASHSTKRILDLYCGFGITSLMLGKQGHSIIGVEYNPAAIKFAQHNTKANRLPHVKFRQGDVEKLMGSLMEEFKPDLVLANPPRTGLTPKVKEVISNTRPNEMIYVSCMPATLARDLNELCGKDYKIEECTVYDMFPQTAHVETLVYLKKRV